MPLDTPQPAFFTDYPGEGLRAALWDRYGALLEAGTPSDQVLVLLESGTRTVWTELLKGRGAGRLGGLGAPTGAQRIHTPQAWAQAALTQWWPLVDAALEELGFPAAGSYPGPVFAPIDLSQHLLKHFARDLLDEDGNLVKGARVGPAFQGVQILDALARGVENGESLLSPAPPPAWGQYMNLPEPALRLAGRIAERLEDGFSEFQRARKLPSQVGAAIALYLDGMLRSRLFDHALTLECFAALLWPDPRFRAHLAETTSHLLVEGLDETPPRWQALYRESATIGLTGHFSLQSDPDGALAHHPFRGGLREYVGADPQGAWEYAVEIRQAVPDRLEPPFAGLGRALHDGLLGEIGPASCDRDRLSVTLDAYSPAEMLEAVVEDLRRVLAAGASPDRVAIVAPSLSPLLIWSLRQKLERLGVPLYVFAGTNRLSDYRPVRLLVTLARLCHEGWGQPPSRFELLELLECATGLNPLRLARLASKLFPRQRLERPEHVAELAPQLGEAELARYGALVAWIEARTSAPATDLEAFFRTAFAEVYAPFLPAEAEEVAQREISQIGQLVELASRFQEVDRRLMGTADVGWGRRFLRFLQESPIAERPFFKREPHRGAVMLATPNQLAEKGFSDPTDSLEHLFLLDVGSDRWWKPERKDLTNARILAFRYPGGPYTPEQEQADMNAKLGRVLLACLLKVQERAWLYGCMTDEEGRENVGELPYLLTSVLEA